jgi:branched-chain amino acid transport system ATP-binding protein
VAAARVATILSEVQANEGITMLVAEQNVGVAFKIAQRVALMNEGRIIREGEASAGYQEDVRSEYVGGKGAER